MELEDFSPVDAATVVDWATSAAEAMDWAGAAVTWPVTPADVQAWRDDPDVRPFVLRDAGEAVAYGEVWLDEEEGEVELARIIVRPDRRGRGTGRAFVRLLLARAAGFGLPVAFVRVAPGNAAALSCYRAAGFTDVSGSQRRAFNEGQPLDYVWLRADLGEPEAAAGAGDDPAPQR